MLRILTKELVDGREVDLSIAHQPRNIIDCDIELDVDKRTRTPRRPPSQRERFNPTVKTTEENNESEDKSDWTDEEVGNVDEEQAIDQINSASAEIKAAIKFKLIRNIYRQYLGVDAPYD